MRSQQSVYHKIENPLFKKQEPQEKKRRYLILVIFCIAALLCVGAIVVLVMLRSESYSIRFIVYSGNIRVSSDDMTHEVNGLIKKKSGSWLLPYRSTYFFPSRYIAKNLQDTFGLSKIDIDVIRHERVAHIRIREQGAAYTVTYGQVTYNAAANGTLLELVPEGNESGLLAFKIEEGAKGESEKNVPERLQALYTQLKDTKLLERPIMRLVLQTANSTDIKLYTDQNWYTYIDATGNITEQLTISENIYKEKIQGTEDEARLQYIDVRIPERVFYK